MRSAKFVDNLTGQEYALNRKRTLLGRKEDNDIVLRSRLISKYHMEVRRGVFGYYLTDTQSTHGFYINGERKWGTTRLNNGDRIRVAAVYDENEENSDRHSSRTIGARHQAILLEKLNGDEENIRIGCDMTFQIEGEGMLENLASMFRGKGQARPQTPSAKKR